MSLGHFPLNPEYGSGCYRRLVTISRDERSVLATVDDTHHAMWVLVEHDGKAVTAVRSGIERGPATTCRGSSAGLEALVGHPFDQRPTARLLPTTANCTHLADLAAWALAGASHPSTAREFEITVPDELDEPVWVTISRDGQLVHKWLIKDHKILAPDMLEGRQLMRGFTAWARDKFKDDALEAALMLQRGVFVARGRTRVVDLPPAIPLRAAAGMANACYSYSGDRLETATSIVGYVRDFTSGVVRTPPPREIIARFEGKGS